MKIYQKPTTKKLRLEPRPIMLQISVRFFDAIENPDDQNGGLANHKSVWDEE